jgi:hypothetical protein
MTRGETRGPRRRAHAGFAAAAVAVAALLLTGAPALAEAAPYAIAPNSIRLLGAFKLGRLSVTVPHRPVTVKVTLPAFAATGSVLLTATLDGKVFKRRTLTHNAAAAGSWRLRVRLAAPAAGVVTIRLAPLARTNGVGFTLRTRFTALTPTASPGATGEFVELLQQRLEALHLYIPQTGVYDQGTELALDAYHRVLGEGEGHTQVDPATVTDLLDGRGQFNVRFPSQGPHAEGDLSDQVLAFINGSKVYWLFPISSGKPSTPTILGNFQVYYKEPEYTSDGMYFSSFFHGGYAIHGYNPAPDYPASHGCMRLPVVDAIPAFNWMAVGDWVDTYYT